ncbi:MULTISPECIES: segregation/condensation protein A [Sporosarcina]|uniref:Segregation and condensation protein A n=1 Tax=Sporosarcina newyorkensis TaxID=759851 RepID=A0A1T4XCC3_9BACL|nr:MULTISPECIES: segregation/condensation protein A [Sporosarcina]MBY0222665.1 segregation/condensation protein A [Sporosarcina aquimarina]SKA87220.1 condensin subunit ScpA [Sporosarcina newyorkensis]
MSYSVKLEVFEGPLDLLLHLINRLEIDIYDIPMAELTHQYIEHLYAMRVLQLDELSEYLVLAATLLEIKSKMLLPVNEEEAFDDDFDYEEEDPREELIARLIEYRKYKEAANVLRESAADRDEHFTKKPEDLSGYGELPVQESEDPLNVFDLIGAFQKMLHRKKLRLPLTASITKTEQSVGDKMSVIMSKLETCGGECEFHALFETETTAELVLTFLSLLELMKLQEVTVRQSNNFEELLISLIQGDV